MSEQCHRRHEYCHDGDGNRHWQDQGVVTTFVMSFRKFDTFWHFSSLLLWD
jgi:hypothetical protein